LKFRQDQNASDNQLLARAPLRISGKYGFPLPYVIARKTRGPQEKSGGIGCFTPDSFPVFDVFHENCYVIADSNHGYKMIGVGELVAGEILGTPCALLEPFRLSRYAQGKLHPVSSSPFPWS
jgi:hypothetical protein